MANIAEEMGAKVGKFIAGAGKTILEGNKPIISNFTGVGEAAGRFISGDSKALANTFAKKGADGVRAAANGWDAGKIAGSYIGGAAAYRALSGGGLYKDKNGNTNIVGLPFV